MKILEKSGKFIFIFYKKLNLLTVDYIKNVLDYPYKCIFSFIMICLWKIIMIFFKYILSKIFLDKNNKHIKQNNKGKKKIFKTNMMIYMTRELYTMNEKRVNNICFNSFFQKFFFKKIEKSVLINALNISMEKKIQ